MFYILISRILEERESSKMEKERKKWSFDHIPTFKKAKFYVKGLLLKRGAPLKCFFTIYFVKKSKSNL